MSVPSGVLTALLTPTRDDGSIDLDAIGGLIDFQVERRVDGLFVLGTAGQGPMLTVDERKQVAETIVKAAVSRIAVVVHVGAMPTAVACELAAHALGAGADAIASVPPVYYQPDASSVNDYYRELASACSGAELLAYNNPSATGYDLRPEQAISLASEGVIAGVKQASANIADLAALLRGGVPVWMANAGCNLAALSMGSQGSISTITNVIPELFVELHRAVAVQEMDRARELQQRIIQAASGLRDPIIGALHAACGLRGLPAGRPRPPLRMPSSEERETISNALEHLNGADLL